MPERPSMLECLIRLLFPPRCIFCGTILPVSCCIEVCSSCFDKLPFTEETFLPPGVESSGTHGCSRVLCLFSYSDIVKDTLKRYKFNEKPSYYRTLGLMLAEKVKKMTNIHEFDIILSVPLHRVREKQRGYNQSGLISRVMAGELAKPELSKALMRVRPTNVQSRLSRESRNINLQGAFQVRKPELIIGKKILLVDDIITTGNTIGEVSKVLRAAGAESVTGAVIASGRA